MADNAIDPFGSGALFDEFDRERHETAPYLLSGDEKINCDNEKTKICAQDSQHKFFTTSSSEDDSDSENKHGKKKSKNRTSTSSPTSPSRNGNDDDDVEVLDLKDRISDLEEMIERLSRENKLIDTTRYQVDEGPGLQVLYMNSSFGRKYKADIEKFIAELVEKDRKDPEDLPRVRLLPSSICLSEKKKDEMDSSTYECIRENHTVLGCSHFYHDYIQDTFGWPLVNHTPALTDGWETPAYDQVYTDSLPIEEVEGDKPAQKQKRVANKPTCFNCGGEHVIRDCKEKRDPAKIRERQAEFHSKMGPNNPSKSRYHIEDDPKFMKYKAGTISDELREAMGLRGNQLPPYIYQMRVHGYPPGHLIDAKIEGSGISLFDRHGREVSNEGESLEEGEVNTTTVKDTYDLEKIVDFPGFNAPTPDGMYDDYRKFNFPPLQEFQLKTRLEEIMGTDVFKRQSEQEKGGRKKKMKIDSSGTGREDVDMDIASGDESEKDVTRIEVKIENKHFKKVKSESEGASASVQSSRTASTASLDDLEQQRELILKQMEDSDQDTQPVEDLGGEMKVEAEDTDTKLKVEGEDSDTNGVPTQSTPRRRIASDSSQMSNSFISIYSTPRSASILKEYGTPIGVDCAKPLPLPEKFSDNIAEHIPYENLPNATGMFEKMQNVVKRVRSQYKSIFN